MKRILLIGNAPLPSDDAKTRPAAGLRTYQFLKPLMHESGKVADGVGNAFGSHVNPSYSIALVTIAMPECYENEPEKKEIIESEKFSHLFISKNDRGLMKAVQKFHDEFHPDAIVSVNTYPSYIASRLKSTAPMWADLNGWIMAEAQAQAHKMESNSYLSHYYNMERSVVERADKFSTVSAAQRFALAGELGFCGRLCAESFGYDFAHVIPNGIEWFEGEKELLRKAGSPEAMSEMALLGGFEEIPEDAFVLLWLGGYNTWVDEKTLFEGVEGAMEHHKNIYFVSTGGGLAGLDDKTFSNFKKMIDGSKFRERFIFLGWVDTKNIPYIYTRAHVGLNIDKKCAETFTGARNRLSEMMKYGLPIITTLGSEVSYEVDGIGAGIGIEHGKSEDLKTAVIRLFREWTENDGKVFETYGINGQKFTKENRNYDSLQAPLIKWLENPRPAPDRGAKTFGGGGFFGKFAAKFRAGFKYLQKNGISKFLKKFRRG